MIRARQILITGLIVSALISLLTRSGGASSEPAAGGEPHGLDPIVLIGIAAILIVAKLTGELFERIGQPAVLGELLGGMLIGSLSILGFQAIDRLRGDTVIVGLAEIGAIILLFEVGLESNLGHMLEVGWSSLLVAVAGVIAPFFLGWAVAAYFIPDEATLGHIFIGATLCATSVGITARVLKDIRKLQTREARIILGAAVIDDVLGLIILAVVKGAIDAQAVGASLSMGRIALIAGKAAVFLVGAVVIGHFVVPQLFHGLNRLEGRGLLISLAIALCFTLAWVANAVGLAYIVGAFAAGLILDEAHFEILPGHDKRDLEELLRPVSTLLVPIFFVLMGMRVDLRVFGRLDLLWFAGALTIAAIIGKQVCSLAVVESGINRLAIGIGMIPRGEVGLIFAAIGATLMIKNSHGADEPVIGPATFGAVIIMVIVTTLVTPPVLKWSLSRREAESDVGGDLPPG